MRQLHMYYSVTFVFVEPVEYRTKSAAGLNQGGYDFVLIVDWFVFLKIVGGLILLCALLSIGNSKRQNGTVAAPANLRPLILALKIAIP